MPMFIEFVFKNNRRWSDYFCWQTSTCKYFSYSTTKRVYFL